MSELMDNPELKAVIGQVIESIFANQRKERVNKNKILNHYVKEGSIVFTGSSLMEHFPVEELSISEGIDKIIYNRGVGGFTTDDFLNDIDTMLLDYKASKVFINIGTNDINERNMPDGNWLEHLTNNYDKILSIIKEKMPKAEVFVMAYYPSNMEVILSNDFGKDVFGVRTLDNIELANNKVKELADKYGFNFIDVNDGLKDEEGNLKKEFTTDGVHMTPDAYAIVLRNMKKYI